MATPLQGIKILDWTQYQMGTAATAMLADLGAEVIHLEPRITGDPGRGLRVIYGNQEDLPDGKSAYFECNNRGKKSITLDLSKQKGKEVVYRLVKKVDVFAHNFRQGVPEKLGLDYETLSKYNPTLVYAVASGYGTKGPEAREPSFDVLGLARSGIMTMVGEPEMPPLQIFGGVGDQMGAIMTGYGILTAIIARDRLGVGQKVEASHLGSMIALQALNIGRQLYLGREVITRVSRRQASVLWNYYPCKDGKWLMLGMLPPDRYWPTICKALGIEHLEKDPKFENADRRAENVGELVDILDRIFVTRTASEWVKVLKETGDVICTPIQGLPDLANDPQVLANEYIINHHHEALGKVKVVGVPIGLSKTPGVIKCEAPELGQNTEEVLIELGGYTWDEISTLREEEVI